MSCPLQSYGLWDHEEDLLAKPQLETEESADAAKEEDEAEPVALASSEAENVVVEEKTEPEAQKGIRSRFRKKGGKKKQLSKSLDDQRQAGT